MSPPRRLLLPLFAATAVATSCVIGPDTTGGDGGANSYVGTWTLVGASCPAGEITFSGLTEKLNLAASSGILTASVDGCTITTSGALQVSGPDLRLLGSSTPAACDPDGCMGSFTLSSGVVVNTGCPMPRFGTDVDLTFQGGVLDLSDPTSGCIDHFEKQ